MQAQLYIITLNLSLATGLAQMGPRDDESLNLRCAFINLENLCITHQLLHGIVTVESIASKDLDKIKIESLNVPKQERTWFN